MRGKRVKRKEAVEVTVPRLGRNGAATREQFFCRRAVQVGFGRLLAELPSGEAVVVPRKDWSVVPVDRRGRILAEVWQ